MINDERERRVDGDTQQGGGGNKAGEDEGSSANEGHEDHLKEDQKTTQR